MTRIMPKMIANPRLISGQVGDPVHDLQPDGGDKIHRRRPRSVLPVPRGSGCSPAPGLHLDAGRLQAVLELEHRLARIRHQITHQQGVGGRLILVHLQDVERLILELREVHVLERVVRLRLDRDPARRAVDRDARA